MKKIYLYLSIAIFFFASCDESDYREPENSRTVIFYLIADNSLSNYTQVNVEELLVGTTKKNLNKGNLILYIDNRKEDPQLLQIEMKGGKAVKKVVKTYEEQDSTDPVVMKKVLNDITKKFTTKQYGLVLWSHGSAWLPEDTDRMIRTRSFGDDRGNVLEISTLKEILSDNVHFDFILFDACYMGNIEVAYELRKTTDYLLASPMEILGKGFPYDKLVGKFFSMPTADVKGICEAFYSYYANQEEEIRRSASVTLVATEKLENLAATMRPIMKTHELDLATVDLQNVQALEYYSEKRLLYDFDDYMKNLTSSNEYASFQNSLREVILYSAYTPTSYFAKPTKSIEINSCCGLTVYPLGFNPELDEWYTGLEWYKDVYQ